MNPISDTAGARSSAGSFPSSNAGSRIETRPAFDAAREGRLRVLQLHSGNLYGGVETMLVTEARLRSTQARPPLEFSFALCFAGRLSEELEAAGAPVHWLSEARVRNPLSLRRARARLRELLRRESFDVVMTHSCWSQAIFGKVVSDAGLPLVFHLHGAASGRHWLERWARRTEPDLVLCNSGFTAGTLHALYPRGHSEVLYCPVAPLKLSFSDAEVRRVRAELQTEASHTVIVQVSRMEEWKGQALHLQALSTLRDVGGWVCWMVGGAQTPAEEKYLDRLRRAALELGISERVRFAGHRKDVERLLAASDIYCQPNTGPEPFGIALVEALYARLPVITTSLGGACEILDQSCGLLVPAGDARALAHALRSLLTDEPLRARLGAAGPARARQLCEPVTQVAKLRDALGALLDRKRAER